MMRVDKNTVVAIRYTMRNSKGDVLEDTLQAAPTSYLQGSPGILYALQAQLAGLKAGDKKKVYLLKETGVTDDDFSFEVIVDQVRAAAPEEIQLGYPLTLFADRCEADCACYE